MVTRSSQSTLLYIEMSLRYPPIPPRPSPVEREKKVAGGAHVPDLPSDPKYLGPWIIGECVGKGAFGRVRIAKYVILTNS